MIRSRLGRAMRRRGKFSLGVGCGCCGGSFYLCGTCEMPQQDLTISWPNQVYGVTSMTMTYTAPHGWNTACLGAGSGNQNLRFSLGCSPVAGVELNVVNFADGNCPNGPALSGCTLSITSLTCGSGFLLNATWTGTGCSDFAYFGPVTVSL
jgi:hypothetical protein